MGLLASGVLLLQSFPAMADLPSAGLSPKHSACGGAGFTELRVAARPRGFTCVHTAGDPFDSRQLAYAKAMGLKPATAPVTCYGDGTTGPRVQMIYGYYDGLPNRATAVTAQFRTQMAPRMQAVVKNQAHGKDLGIRFAWTKGCRGIDVKVIKFPRSIQYGGDPANPNDQIKRAIMWLAANGYNRDDRKYQILWDGWNNKGACGIGELADDMTTGANFTGAPVAPLSDGLPTVGGHTDPGTVARLGATHVSMIFNHVGGPHGPTCFDSQGISTVTPQLHELFHTLGAVQISAPHGNDTGHCDDAPSVMCPGQGPGYGQGVSNRVCARVIVETLDCGEDDYWNPFPTASSYLASHLNIAKSQFFGPQVADSLVSSPV